VNRSGLFFGNCEEMLWFTLKPNAFLPLGGKTSRLSQTPIEPVFPRDQSTPAMTLKQSEIYFDHSSIPPFFSALGLGGKQTLLLTGCSRGFKQQKLLDDCIARFIPLLNSASAESGSWKGKEK
jgi:hypothetical protein